MENKLWTPDYVLPSNYEIYIKPSDLEVSQRKMEGYRKLAEIKRWGLNNPTKFMSEILGVELLDNQTYVFMNSWHRKYVLWAESRAAGKMLDLNTRIPTPYGDKTMGELKLGDYVFNEKGEPTQITYLSPINFNPESYLVTFSDGETIKACAEHNWYVWRQYSHKYVVRTTKEMLADYKKTRITKPKDDGTNRAPYFYEYNYRVDIASPVNYINNIPLPVDPYLLGLWLGNGAASTSCIDLFNEDADEIIGYLLDNHNILVSKRDMSSHTNTYRVTFRTPDNKPLSYYLRQMGLLEEKFIPECYLYASVQDRLSLLQGLMDTDGTISKNGDLEFCQGIIHHRLTQDISKLLTSLGYKHLITQSVKTCQTGKFTAERIHFRGDKEQICFKIKRKAEKLPDHKPKASRRKSIVSIEKCEPVPMRCIEVDSPSHLYLCGEKNTITHNTTMLALFFMTKTLLLNNYRAVISSGTAAQSIETFKKIEDIAKRNITSFTGLTDIFPNEVVHASNSDGFIHNPMGFTFQLYNGSNVRTINSAIDSQRGKRANGVCFDECGWLPEETLQVIGAYTANDANFKLGGETDINALPQEMPNQLLYASSVSSIDTPFWNRYRDFSKKMFLGDDRYFVADINCNVVINATYKGKLYPASLLSQETVDNEARQNPQKANREYYNIFTEDGGVNQIIKRAVIARNTVTMPPILYNEDDKMQFVFAYDPARTLDNSTLGVGLLFEDPKKGWMMKICNSINFADLGLRKRTPMRSPEQVAAIKQYLLQYNGKNRDYDNVEIFMDAGAGGGGTIIPDYFMEDWYEEGHEGDPDYMHRGLIDPEYSKDYVGRFPNAIRKLHVLPPSAYKSIMYESLIENMNNDLIIFPQEFDSHGFLNILDIDDDLIRETREKLKAKNMTDEQIAAQIEKLDSAKTRVYKLSPDEMVALSQIDMMKEEVVNICRFKTETGKDRFNLPAHKDASAGAMESNNTLHKYHCAIAA